MLKLDFSMPSARDLAELKQSIMAVICNIKCDSCHQIMNVAFILIACTQHCTIIMFVLRL